MFETNGQASIFLATVYAGLAAGLVYDALTMIAAALGYKKTVTGALDIIFWLAASGIFASAMALSGGNGLRAYMLLGFACGGLLYAAGFHRALQGAAGAVSRAFRRVRWRIVKRHAKVLQHEGIHGAATNT